MQRRGTLFLVPSLVDKVTIPKGAKELRLFVPLAPEGLNETNGEVTIRYPLKKK